MAKSKRQSKSNVEAFLLENVGLHPNDLVAVAMSEFSLTRPTIHTYLTGLIKKGLITKSGTKNKVSYAKSDLKLERIWVEKIGPEGDEDRIWETHFKPLTKKLPKNLIDVLYYSTTEMVNNAIDHSGGSLIRLRFEETKSQIEVSIIDDGVGIFKKISDSLGLEDQRESILHLAKGKFTTDAANHTGQGIFFTSRAVNEFSIHSGRLVYIRHRKESDWLIETRNEPAKGTWITLILNKDSDIDLRKLFDKFADEKDPGFFKTHVMVEMARLTEESYVSRSQARRLMLGLEKFEEVVLDFQEVRSVGQGFVDEVFRVFQNKHPKIRLVPIHMNSDVKFMIERGLKD